MIRTVFCALLLAKPVSAETVLRLSETAHVAVHPDQLEAGLRADATAPTPAAAQAQVNTVMAEALRQTKATPGIMIATGAYQVWQVSRPANQPGPIQFHAGQSLELTGKDGDVILTLVGALQGRGLSLTRLAWDVAPATGRAAQSEATRQALSRLKARAEEAAGILGLRFVAFREVRLDGTRPPPVFAPRVLSMANAAPAPTPSAEAQDADIQASVEGDALLADRP